MNCTESIPFSFNMPERSTKRMRANENVNTSNIPSVNGADHEKLKQMALNILKANSKKQSVDDREPNFFDQVEKQRESQVIRYKELVKNKENVYLQIIYFFQNNGLVNRIPLLKSILFSHRAAGDVIGLFQNHFKVDVKIESKVKHYLNLKTLAAQAERQLARKPNISAKVVKKDSLIDKHSLINKKITFTF